ncbi:MAG: cytochrome c biogenesis protein CcsA [Phycisphaeraceae bacterium]|nr:cytochrome c biogenesis protein CcsA [Phycisphaeraceae bacterium]MCB9847381.1 cytochrome c biogenesis protein CcsA [Phycisphaeraceae bacterium]
MTIPQRLMPWLMIALAALILAGAYSGREIEGPMDWEALGEIPVSASGRIKPLDTYARNTLMVISGRQTLVENGERVPAIRWYADVLARPDVAAKQDIFRIDHPDLVALLGFKTAQEGGKKRFSFDELSPNFEEISKQADLAFQVDAKNRDPFQRQALTLYNRVSLYLQTARVEAPYTVPPLKDGEEWRPMFVMTMSSQTLDNPAVRGWNDIFRAYAQDDAAGFNKAVQDYRGLIEPGLGSSMKKARSEVFFNEFKPFYQSMLLYVLAFLLAGAGFMLASLAKREWSKSLWNATMCVLLIAFAVHTGGLIFRIVLQGRPPVTNLYSSAVFIGWACVLIGIILEKIHRIGLAGMASAIIGFTTLIVAHNLANTGDTMEMMQAVLDSNFWLATHVVVVTIGYSATFLAGFLAIAFILLGVLTPLLRDDRGKALSRMIYGVICFGAVASFVGTVLGGIWADQSWGRFWGWDPKENGAVLIVLMNLLILHARWGGMIRERGVAVLAVCGNIVTSWSWFGTNMLGVGLHSYGFIDSAIFYMLLFVSSQLVVMAIGLTPWKHWRSFNPKVKAKREPQPRVQQQPA